MLLLFIQLLPSCVVPAGHLKIHIARTRTNTTPNGTKAVAAGLSARASVRRIRSSEKGGICGNRRSLRRDSY